jgi:hypothetical protein
MAGRRAVGHNVISDSCQMDIRDFNPSADARTVSLHLAQARRRPRAVAARGLLAPPKPLSETARPAFTRPTPPEHEPVVASVTITTRRFTYSDLRLVAKTAFSDLRLVAKNL